MNKIIYTPLIISLIFIFAMCSNDNENSSDPAIKLKHASGFLGTIGVYSNGESDTVCIRMGAHSVTSFSSTTEANGYIKRPKDIYTLSNNGANQWLIKNFEGKYLGIDGLEEDEQYYSHTFYESINEAATFVMNADDDGNFYLEPVAKRGFYLNTKSQDGYLEHRFIDFLPNNKQKWFILP